MRVCYLYSYNHFREIHIFAQKNLQHLKITRETNLNPKRSLCKKAIYEINTFPHNICKCTSYIGVHVHNGI